MTEHPARDLQRDILATIETLRAKLADPQLAEGEALHLQEAIAQLEAVAHPDVEEPFLALRAATDRFAQGHPSLAAVVERLAEILAASGL